MRPCNKRPRADQRASKSGPSNSTACLPTQCTRQGHEQGLGLKRKHSADEQSPGVEAEIPVIAVDIDGGDCRNTTGPPPPFLPHQARVVFARRDLQRMTILTVVDVQPDLVPPGNRGRLVARIRRESEG